ncbi:hypothetical protein ABC795_06825 [Blastococcus sp. HT6-30]|uniref:hypothetical protein n=1 Tax=Blastococcus sp. HT6-30 TaxID=3144843 RepID=UPI00321ACE69
MARTDEDSPVGGMPATGRLLVACLLAVGIHATGLVGRPDGTWWAGGGGRPRRHPAALGHLDVAPSPRVRSPLRLDPGSS